MADGFLELDSIKSNLIHPPRCEWWGYGTGLGPYNFVPQPIYIHRWYTADALRADLKLMNSLLYRCYSVIACYLRGVVIDHNMSNVSAEVDNLSRSSGEVRRAHEFHHSQVYTGFYRRYPFNVDDIQDVSSNAITVAVGDDNGGDFRPSVMGQVTGELDHR